MNPFRGPRPYVFQNRSGFFGRDKDLQPVRLSVLTKKISILHGNSGCGKSSFVEALLLPRLQEDWRQTSGHSPFPLLFTNWSEGEANARLADKLLERLHFPEQDASTDSGGSRPNSAAVVFDDPNDVFANHNLSEKYLKDALDVLSDERSTIRGLKDPAEQGRMLAQAFDRMSEKVEYSFVLILDQTEELFRSFKEAGTSFIATLSSFATYTKYTRVLISLRSEYLRALLPLESSIGNIFENAVTLLPVEDGSTLEDFQKALEKIALQTFDYGNDCNKPATITLQPKTRSTIVERLLKEHQQDGILLQFQAFFEEFYDYAIKKVKQQIGNGKDPEIEIDDDFLSSFLKSLPTFSSDQEGKTDSGYSQALQRYVDRSLRRIGNDSEDASKFKPDNLFWCSLALLPDLTSSDYKVSVDVRRLIKKVQKLAEYLKFAPAHQKPDEKEAQFAKDLLDRTLDDLKTRNLIKIFDSGTETEFTRRVEITHDQLAPPIDAWCDAEQYSWESCIDSPFINRGLPIKVAGRSIDFPKELTHNFQGCILHDGQNTTKKHDSTDRKNTFDGIVFTDCLFIGSIFRECSFHNCHFKNCLFSGTLFDQCKFTNCSITSENERKKRYQFIFFGCAFDGLTFKSLHIEQANFSQTPGKGPQEGLNSISANRLIFDSCDVQLSILKGFEDNSVARLRVKNPVRDRLRAGPDFPPLRAKDYTKTFQRCAFGDNLKARLQGLDAVDDNCSFDEKQK
jgi:hypothetical protein